MITATPRTPVTQSVKLGWILSVMGLVGFAAALALSIERYRLLLNPDYVPSCSINPILSCGSIMSTNQAAVLGFPNPFIGLAGFSALVMFGVFMATGVKPVRFLLAGLQVAVTAASLFTGWLVFQSLYTIGALCIYCMVVWLVMSVVFWAVSGYNAATFTFKEGSKFKKVAGIVNDYSVVWIMSTVTIILILILVRFWYYWETLLL